MRYLMDTNILSALVRSPRGPIFERIGERGEDNVYTSVVVAAELRYGVARKGSERLSRQVEAILDAIDIAPIRPPTDRIYGDIRWYLERSGSPIGANDLLIAAQALSEDSTLVTDNMKEFERVPGLKIENWLRS